MLIVDIHTHVFKKVASISRGMPMTSTALGRVKVGNREEYFLPPAFENSNSPTEVLLGYMDHDGVDKALLMANPYYGYHNDYFEQSVEQYPGRLRGVAYVDPLKGEEAAAELDGIYSRGKLFGFKIEVNTTFQCDTQARLTDPRLAPVWDCVNSHRQPAFLHILRNCDVPDIGVLAGRYPNINFIMCHMGADACFESWADKGNFDLLLDIAGRNKNVYLDTSTVPSYYKDEEYPFPTACAIVRKAYEALGPERLMWSSDYPLALNWATMKQLIDYTLEHALKGTPLEHRELIMGLNADRLFF